MVATITVLRKLLDFAVKGEIHTTGKGTSATFRASVCVLSTQWRDPATWKLVGALFFSF